MIGLSAITFVQPWLLLPLVLLPLLWWLLRATPPAPKRLSFPAIRLLMGLKPLEETPQRTPWWLLLLRLLIAALIITAFARPLINATTQLSSDNPLLVVVDDGWSAANGWRQRQAALDLRLAEAERAGLPVRLLLTAPGQAGEAPTVSDTLSASEARARVAGLQPKPWPLDRAAAADALAGLSGQAQQVIWASDGLQGDAVGAQALGRALANLGRVTQLRPAPGALPRLIRPPSDTARGIAVAVERPAAAEAAPLTLRALRDDGREVGRTTLAFEPDALEASAQLELPLALRNAIARLVLLEERSAAATLLLDGRARRLAVGLVEEAAAEPAAQPLLTELHYVEQALAPFSVITRGSLESLLEQPLSVLVIPDRGALSGQQQAQLDGFMQEGGLVLRFAGPRLAASPDNLTPVPLRTGDRRLGGVMSWEEPSAIAPFTDGPFAGLAVPDEVTVDRQVLAEPSPELAERTWARLADGTPLVTAANRGEGLLVLVHTTAGPTWSNLALSGLFVDLLRRVVETAKGLSPLIGDRRLPPISSLDAYGRLQPPDAAVLDLTAATVAEAAVGPRHPPGYYGTAEARQAFNLETAVPSLATLPAITGVTPAPYSTQAALDLKPWLLTAAFILLLIDFLIALGLRGLLLRPAATAGALLGAALLIAALPQGALADDGLAMEATRDTRLAFVETGNDEVDAISRVGLQGLATLLNRRTAVEAGAPIGVDLERDELAFFPLLYWPITPDQPNLSQEAADRVNAFLASGGAIFFDLRDPGGGGPASSATAALRRLTEGLEIPPLAPVPPEHVLTKTFYLMQDFPGRYDGGTLWIDTTGTVANDGVARVLIGANDYAAAWALDRNGRPHFATVPGGERQREMAFRFGINLVLYSLTGNYKADQVHVPFILERLGQ
ncbi:MAG: DUF4159 domain-containing protein [Pseudomonadota bacterium]